MKKFLCLLLVIVMVAMPLVACKDDSDGGKETDGGNQPVQTAAQSGDGTGTAASTDVYEVPADLKYDGKSFNFLYEQEQGYGYFPLDFDEPSSEDAYANAIYLRNSAVEEQLGVTQRSSLWQTQQKRPRQATASPLTRCLISTLTTPGGTVTARSSSLSQANTTWCPAIS